MNIEIGKGCFAVDKQGLKEKIRHVKFNNRMFYYYSVGFKGLQLVIYNDSIIYKQIEDLILIEGNISIVYKKLDDILLENIGRDKMLKYIRELEELAEKRGKEEIQDNLKELLGIL